MRRPATCLALLLLLTGCSSSLIYNGLREYERSLCAEGPAVQYAECRQRVEMDYRTYRKLGESG